MRTNSPELLFYTFRSNRKPTAVLINFKRLFYLSAKMELSKVNWNDESYFKFTRARFVCNEAHEMAERRVKFDLRQLAFEAQDAIKSGPCISVEKYPDGMFNKSYLLTMERGQKVVAKVPNPNAQSPQLTMASEVATMEFVRCTFVDIYFRMFFLTVMQARLNLGTPVPKILRWCSRANESAVGAEFIITEKAKGVQLSSVWPKMTIQNRFAFLRNLAKLQRKWTQVVFSHYGSLYHSEDLDSNSQKGQFYTEDAGKP